MLTRVALALQRLSCEVASVTCTSLSRMRNWLKFGQCSHCWNDQSIFGWTTYVTILDELHERFTAILVDPDELLFDPNNPRYHGDFLDYVFVPHAQIGLEDQQERAFKRILDKRFAVKELAKSIAQVGYLPIDNFVVARYDANRYLVIEGNRRLAALRLILEGRVKFRLDDPDSLRQIPALRLDETHEEAAIDQWVIQGTRHVGGVKAWGPFQKARAIEILHKERGMEYSEAGAAIGLSKLEVNRAIRTLQAFREFQSHSLYGRRSRPDHFSFFDEMVRKPVLRDYFGWSNRAMEFGDAKKRDFLFKLIVGDPKTKSPPKISAALELRRLARVVENPEALASLEDLSQPLERAFFLESLSEKDAISSELVARLEATTSALERRRSFSPTPTQRGILKKVVDTILTLLDS